MVLSSLEHDPHRHRLTAGEHVLLLGAGYVGRRLAQVALHDEARVSGTTRSPERGAELEAAGIVPLVGATPAEALAGATDDSHWLISAPPDDNGADPFLLANEALDIVQKPRWIGYLSSTSVYGDAQGEWVDEDTPPAPTALRGERRVKAEQAWLQWGERHGVATHIFRLGGIYGPGRSALDRVRAGTARVIVKPNKVFNRIHVDDIVRVLLASMGRPRHGGVYNVIDGHPLPPESATLEAFRLLNVPPPAPVAWDSDAVRPTVRAFYDGNVRVRSTRLEQELRVALAWPDALAGLSGIFASEQP